MVIENNSLFMKFVFDLVNVFLIVTLALNFILGIIIYSRGKGSRINRVYSWNILFIMSWAVGMLLYRSADINYSLFWCVILYLTPTQIASSFLYFTYIFPQVDGSISFAKKSVIFFLNIAILLLVLVPGAIIKGVTVPLVGEKIILFGNLYFLYVLYILGFFSFGFWRLFKKYLKTSGIGRRQISYLLFGYSLAANVAFVTNLILPWFGYTVFNWVGQVFTISMVVFTFYAIVKYRLMDIKVVVRRSTMFTLLVVILTAIYSFLIIFFGRTFGDVLGVHSQLITSLTVSILIVIGFQPLKAFIQKTTKRFLFKDEYDPQGVIAELSEALSSSLEIDHLFDSVDRIIDKTLHPVSVATSLFDKKKENYVLARQKGFTVESEKQLNLSSNDFLISHFKADKNIIVLQELKRKVETGYLLETKEMTDLISRLEATTSEVFLPLISKEKIIGITFLGEKKSGDVYTAEDIRLLEIGSSQAAVAIENSLMYEDAKNFNVTLTKEIEKATRELRLANKNLKKLDEAKSEFISIASHQLRTPLTVIKGYISMMLEGSFGQLTDQEVESLHKVYESNQRLINLVEDLLNISRIESGRIQYNMEEYGLDDLAASVVDELVNNAKNKKLYLKFDKPTEVLPKVKMDTDKLRQVLMNMVDNAIKYTSKGGIRVSVYQEGKNLVLKVIDTGMGIDPADLPNLFQKFSRGKGMSKVHTEGVGLGLYVAKQMLEAHGGKIWAESKGKDLGSVFCMTIPIAKN